MGKFLDEEVYTPKGKFLDEEEPSIDYEAIRQAEIDSIKQRLAQQQMAEQAQQQQAEAQKAYDADPNNWSSSRFKKESPTPKTPQDQAKFDQVLDEKKYNESVMRIINSGEAVTNFSSEKYKKLVPKPKTAGESAIYHNILNNIEAKEAKKSDDLVDKIGGGFTKAKESVKEGTKAIGEFAAPVTEPVGKAMDATGKFVDRFGAPVREGIRGYMKEPNPSRYGVDGLSESLMRGMGGAEGVVKGIQHPEKSEKFTSEFLKKDPLNEKLTKWGLRPFIDSLPIDTAQEFLKKISPITGFEMSDEDLETLVRGVSGVPASTLGMALDFVSNPAELAMAVLGDKGLKYVSKMKYKGMTLGARASELPVGEMLKNAEVPIPKTSEPFQGVSLNSKDTGSEVKLEWPEAEKSVKEPKQFKSTIPEDTGMKVNLAMDLEENGPPGINFKENGKRKIISFRDENGEAKAILKFDTIEPGSKKVDTRYDYSPGPIVYVDPSLRRKGIATKLYDYAESQGYDIGNAMGKFDLTPEGAAFVNARNAKAPALKTSTLGKGVEEKAIESKLTQGFSDLPQYKEVNMQDQASRASELIKADYEQAKRIAMGHEPPPKDVLPESVFVAVENKAIADGDVNTLRNLATESKLVGEATTMGQRIRTLAERDMESPVGAMKDVAKTREEALQKRLKNTTVDKAKQNIVNNIKKEIRKAVPSKESWASFISSLEC